MTDITFPFTVENVALAMAERDATIERLSANLLAVSEELAEAWESIESKDDALQNARAQLITLGGSYCGPDCDQIQCAVLREIEEALHPEGKINEHR